MYSCLHLLVPQIFVFQKKETKSDPSDVLSHSVCRTTLWAFLLLRKSIGRFCFKACEACRAFACPNLSHRLHCSDFLQLWWWLTCTICFSNALTVAVLRWNIHCPLKLAKTLIQSVHSLQQLNTQSFPYLYPFIAQVLCFKSSFLHALSLFC